MQIIRNATDTAKGPADWFTGDVYIDAVAAPAGSSTFAAANVHFTPGARTAWHTHPHGQTIFVTEGVGVCQREDGPVETIRAGDRVFFEPGENHWHGAAPKRFMVHLAMQQNDDSGIPVTWGRQVTDDEYAAAQDAFSCHPSSRVRPSIPRRTTQQDGEVGDGSEVRELLGVDDRAHALNQPVSDLQRPDCDKSAVAVEQ